MHKTPRQQLIRARLLIPDGWALVSMGPRLANRGYFGDRRQLTNSGYTAFFIGSTTNRGYFMVPPESEFLITL